MAITTIITGVLLIALGLVSYIGTGSKAPTALIPAGFGLIIAIFGFLAQNPKRRAMAMHVAVAIGALGFLGSLIQCIKGYTGEAIHTRPAAVEAQAVMALVTGIFVALCVNSFIKARRARNA